MATNNHIGWTSVDEDSSLLYFICPTHTHIQTVCFGFFSSSFNKIILEQKTSTKLSKNNAITVLIVLVGIVFHSTNKTWTHTYTLEEYYASGHEIEVDGGRVIA